MTIYNFGSINLDHLYRVPHFVRPGETLGSSDYQIVLGGKGANQSIALAQAGVEVKHVGAIHSSDHTILTQLSDYGVDTSLISFVEQATGHAIIQLNDLAENAIILYAGANHSLSEQQVDAVLAQAQVGDWVLLQSETNLVTYIIEAAREKQLKIAFNPAPMDASLTLPVLDKVDLLIVNEVEAMDLMAVTRIKDAVTKISRDYPELAVLMTLGAAGVQYVHADHIEYVAAFKVDAVDTTAAGDTFIGFCLAALSQGMDSVEAIKQGCAAAAVCVTQLGASPSIPSKTSVSDFLETHS